LHSASWLNFATPFYSAIGASLVGHGIVYHLLTRYPVSLITPLLLLAPVLAVAFGVLLWGDVLTWKLILGGRHDPGGHCRHHRAAAPRGAGRNQSVRIEPVHPAGFRIPGEPVARSAVAG
jgi:hypothetical protein